MSNRVSTAPVSWSVPFTEVSHHPTQRAGIYSSNKYLSFWLLGSLSIALLLLIVLLGYCSRRVAHRRASREQAHVLPGANVAPRAGRYLRPPVGDPHSREILLCAACRSAQDEMFRLAKAAPVPGSAARWSPPPPYTPRSVTSSNTLPGTQSHL
ncbi:uncharacterized protein LOC119383156 [Rhipicephalus sanguineus]|uniref:uncharacterized protein LOC119383156 n=1 Tax=Rhipicephalus sanguineus TaxID=34632 RepID=UPI00189527AE|nr:uncharacterized protein LOC119383156 [Rhipicephalus sanguineus]